MYLDLNTKYKRPCHVIIINTTTFVGEHLLFRSRCIFHRRITHRKPLIVCEVLTSVVMDKGKGVMGLGRRWAVEITDNSTSNSVRDVPDPPGFNRSSREQDDSAVSKQKKDAEANWKAQKAWEVAQAPFKNLFMMAFMMWMAGSTVNIFSIGITISALFQPINALRGVGKVFEPYKDNKVDLLAPKLVFIALNLVGLGIGIWKLNTLGLLPTHVSDWVSSLPPAQEIEYSGGGIPLH